MCSPPGEVPWHMCKTELIGVMEYHRRRERWLQYMCIDITVRMNPFCQSKKRMEWYSASRGGGGGKVTSRNYWGRQFLHDWILREAKHHVETELNFQNQCQPLLVGKYRHFTFGVCPALVMFCTHYQYHFFLVPRRNYPTTLCWLWFVPRMSPRQVNIRNSSEGDWRRGTCRSLF